MLQETAALIVRRAKTPTEIEDGESSIAFDCGSKQSSQQRKGVLDLTKQHGVPLIDR
jgi:hypothetical protein